MMSAFAVFYFQHPSMTDFQKAMEEREKRNNLRALFGVENIPWTDQVRNVLDSIEPKELFGAFDRAPETAEESGVLEKYRVLEGTIPVALDGTWYFSSKEIHREHCLTKMTTKNRCCTVGLEKRRKTQASSVTGSATSREIFGSQAFCFVVQVFC